MIGGLDSFALSHLATLPPCHLVINLLGHADQHRFGANLHKNVDPLLGQGGDAVGKAHGLADVVAPVAGGADGGGGRFAGQIGEQREPGGGKGDGACDLLKWIEDRLHEG